MKSLFLPGTKQNSGSFKKGNPGKPVGAVHKLTRTVKETVLSVFNDLQDDPKANLNAWAQKEPTEFYKIASKLIPTEITGQVKHTITVSRKKIDADGSTD